MPDGDYLEDTPGGKLLINLKTNASPTFWKNIEPEFPNFKHISLIPQV